ncbi:hypothetical protein T439DRAFT_322320 [Meredithblackwellia eburnea MCA 4105]
MPPPSSSPTPGLGLTSTSVQQQQHHHHHHHQPSGDSTTTTSNGRPTLPSLKPLPAPPTLAFSAKNSSKGTATKAPAGPPPVPPSPSQLDAALALESMTTLAFQPPPTPPHSHSNITNGNSMVFKRSLPPLAEYSTASIPVEDADLMRISYGLYQAQVNMNAAHLALRDAEGKFEEAVARDPSFYTRSHLCYEVFTSLLTCPSSNIPASPPPTDIVPHGDYDYTSFASAFEHFFPGHGARGMVRPPCVAPTLIYSPSPPPPADENLHPPPQPPPHHSNSPSSSSNRQLHSTTSVDDSYFSINPRPVYHSSSSSSQLKPSPSLEPLPSPGLTTEAAKVSAATVLAGAFRRDRVAELASVVEGSGGAGRTRAWKKKVGLAKGGDDDDVKGDRPDVGLGVEMDLDEHDDDDASGEDDDALSSSRRGTNARKRRRPSPPRPKLAASDEEMDAEGERDGEGEDELDGSYSSDEEMGGSGSVGGGEAGEEIASRPSSSRGQGGRFSYALPPSHSHPPVNSNTGTTQRRPSTGTSSSTPRPSKRPKAAERAEDLEMGKKRRQPRAIAYDERSVFVTNERSSFLLVQTKEVPDLSERCCVELFLVPSASTKDLPLTRCLDGRERYGPQHREENMTLSCEYIFSTHSGQQWRVTFTPTSNTIVTPIAPTSIPAGHAYTFVHFYPDSMVVSDRFPVGSLGWWRLQACVGAAKHRGMPGDGAWTARYDEQPKDRRPARIVEHFARCRYRQLADDPLGKFARAVLHSSGG